MTSSSTTSESDTGTVLDELVSLLRSSNISPRISIPLKLDLAVTKLLKAAKLINVKHVEALVASLENNGTNLCARLSSRTFVIVLAIFRLSKPCRAQQRGLALLRESLNDDDQAVTATQVSIGSVVSESASQIRRKSCLGAEVLLDIVGLYLESRIDVAMRHQIGLLVLELVHECKENQKRLRDATEHLRPQFWRMFRDEADGLIMIIAALLYMEFHLAGSPLDVLPHIDSSSKITLFAALKGISASTGTAITRLQWAIKFGSAIGKVFGKARNNRAAFVVENMTCSTTTKGIGGTNLVAEAAAVAVTDQMTILTLKHDGNVPIIIEVPVSAIRYVSSMECSKDQAKCRIRCGLRKGRTGNVHVDGESATLEFFDVLDSADLDSRSKLRLAIESSPFFEPGINSSQAIEPLDVSAPSKSQETKEHKACIISDNGISEELALERPIGTDHHVDAAGSATKTSIVPSGAVSNAAAVISPTNTIIHSKSKTTTQRVPGTAKASISTDVTSPASDFAGRQRFWAEAADAFERNCLNLEDQDDVFEVPQSPSPIHNVKPAHWKPLTVRQKRVSPALAGTWRTSPTPYAPHKIVPTKSKSGKGAPPKAAQAERRAAINVSMTNASTKNATNTTRNIKKLIPVNPYLADMGKATEVQASSEVRKIRSRRNAKDFANQRIHDIAVSDNVKGSSANVVPAEADDNSHVPETEEYQPLALAQQSSVASIANESSLAPSMKRANKQSEPQKKPRANRTSKMKVELSAEYGGEKSDLCVVQGSSSIGKPAAKCKVVAPKPEAPRGTLTKRLQPRGQNNIRVSQPAVCMAQHAHAAMREQVQNVSTTKVTKLITLHLRKSAVQSGMQTERPIQSSSGDENSTESGEGKGRSEKRDPDTSIYHNLCGAGMQPLSTAAVKLSSMGMYDDTPSTTSSHQNQETHLSLKVQTPSYHQAIDDVSVNDDHLERKQHLISFSTKGPRNQGVSLRHRLPANEKFPTEDHASTTNTRHGAREGHVKFNPLSDVERKHAIKGAPGESAGQSRASTMSLGKMSRRDHDSFSRPRRSSSRCGIVDELDSPTARKGRAPIAQGKEGVSDVLDGLKIIGDNDCVSNSSPSGSRIVHLNGRNLFQRLRRADEVEESVPEKKTEVLMKEPAMGVCMMTRAPHTQHPREGINLRTLEVVKSQLPGDPFSHEQTGTSSTKLFDIPQSIPFMNEMLQLKEPVSETLSKKDVQSVDAGDAQTAVVNVVREISPLVTTSHLPQQAEKAHGKMSKAVSPIIMDHGAIKSKTVRLLCGEGKSSDIAAIRNHPYPNAEERRICTPKTGLIPKEHYDFRTRLAPSGKRNVPQAFRELESEDPDKTLVTNRVIRKRRRLNIYANSATSDSNLSSSGTDSGNTSELENALGQGWREVLPRHQRELFDQLVILSRNLVQRMADKEIDVEHVIQRYQNHGKYIISGVAERHEAAHKDFQNQLTQARKTLTEELKAGSELVLQTVEQLENPYIRPGWVMERDKLRLARQTFNKTFA